MRSLVPREFDFFGSRNVQHMKSVFVSLCESHGPLRGDDRGFMIADSAVIGDVVATVQSDRICSDRRFVFTMRADWKSCLSEDSFQCLLFINKQVTVLEPMKILMPGVRVAFCSESEL